MLALSAAGVLSLAGCNTTPPPPPLPAEAFAQSSQYSHSYTASAPVTCEAARRALLNSGYVINRAKPAFVDGVKSFQSGKEAHVEIQFHVVCAPEGRDGHTTVAFINAVQDTFTLKKVTNPASLGVGVLGAVSLPLTQTDDAMVKVWSETVTDKAFYDRFFGLVTLYLDPDQEIPKTGYEDPPPPPKILLHPD